MGSLAGIRSQVAAAHDRGEVASVRISRKAWALARREYARDIGSVMFSTPEVFGAPVSLVGEACKTRVLARKPARWTEV